MTRGGESIEREEGGDVEPDLGASAWPGDGRQACEPPLRVHAMFMNTELAGSELFQVVRVHRCAEPTKNRTLPVAGSDSVA